VRVVAIWRTSPLRRDSARKTEVLTLSPWLPLVSPLRVGYSANLHRSSFAAVGADILTDKENRFDRALVFVAFFTPQLRFRFR
jgi:hypothetical protein